MASIPTSAVLHTLKHADGSATYTSVNKTHTILAGVNYPVEVPYRSDEIPDSTYIEINLRPHNGVGMVKERHVEQLIARTLKRVVLGEDTPRTMLQITLQVIEMEVDETLPGGVKGEGQGASYLDLLVGSINTSVLACLDAGVQMRCLVGAVTVGVQANRHGTVLVPNPSVQQRKGCTSVHAFAYTNQGSCVLMESEGSFDLEEWNAAEKVAQQLVLARMISANGDVEMDVPIGGAALFDVIRNSVRSRVSG